MEPKTFRLRPAEIELLAELAEARGESQTEVIREGLRCLQRQEERTMNRLIRADYLELRLTKELGRRPEGKRRLRLGGRYGPIGIGLQFGDVVYWRDDDDRWIAWRAVSEDGAEVGIVKDSEIQWGRRIPISDGDR